MQLSKKALIRGQPNVKMKIRIGMAIAAMIRIVSMLTEPPIIATQLLQHLQHGRALSSVPKGKLTHNRSAGETLRNDDFFA